jgi:hypothetical protein
MTEEACCEKMEKFSPPSTCDTPSGEAVPDEYLKGVSVPGPVHSIACCRRMNKCYLKAKTQRKRRAMGSDTEFSHSIAKCDAALEGPGKKQICI